MDEESGRLLALVNASADLARTIRKHVTVDPDAVKTYAGMMIEDLGKVHLERAEHDGQPVRRWVLTSEWENDGTAPARPRPDRPTPPEVLDRLRGMARDAERFTLTPRPPLRRDVHLNEFSPDAVTIEELLEPRRPGVDRSTHVQHVCAWGVQAGVEGYRCTYTWPDGVLCSSRTFDPTLFHLAARVVVFQRVACCSDPTCWCLKEAMAGE